MNEYLQAYQAAVICLGLAGGLIVLQILIADVVAIANKHTPGMPIDQGHGSFLFRSARSAANTGETLSAFIACLLFCLFIGANPEWTNGLAMLYIGARVAHMVSYYLDWRLARSAIFAFTIVAIVGLCGLGFSSI
jgi:uncharacterized MAPEG superfamily protein